MVYYTHGSFYPNMVWDDFFSQEGPSVTINVNPEKIAEGKKFSYSSKKNDDWYDAFVRKLDLEMAKQVLGHINHCPPEEIEITEKGMCTAVGS